MPQVIGIGGGTASGKTTLAAALADALGARATLLIHDRYYRSLPAGRAPLDHNFDHPDALDTARLVADLDQLRAGRPTRVPVYEFKRHARADHDEEITAAAVVIVEGILVLNDPALRQRFDHAIYVDAPDDIRLARRLLRDVATRGRTPDEVVAQYLKTVRPMHEAFVAPSRAFAGLVLDGTAPVDGLLGDLRAYCRV